MQIQGVIFDLGHTLMYLDGTWSEVFRQGEADLAGFVSSLSPAVDGSAFASTFLQHRSEAFAYAKETMREVTAEATMHRTFSAFGMPHPPSGVVRQAIEVFFAYEADCWYAHRQAKEVLHTLAARGLRLGIFSNATDDLFIQRLVDRLGFRPWLEPVLSSAGTGIRKPSSDAFSPFVKSWGLDPRYIVVVGDTLEADIQGAQQAGMCGVWLRSREDARQEGWQSGNTHTPNAKLKGLAPETAEAACKPPPIIEPVAVIDDLSELVGCLRNL
jgi:HAD superfamily hydrolase (TIGR01549 family)